MRDSVSAAFQNEFVKGFEAAHPDIKVKVQIQEWDGIGEKVTAALASNDAPDVIETGNTRVAQFAQSGGGLPDLSDKVDDLGGKTWLKGLAEPGAHDGKQYGIPYYAANRVVVYRTDLFERAARRTSSHEHHPAPDPLSAPERRRPHGPGVSVPGVLDGRDRVHPDP